MTNLSNKKPQFKLVKHHKLDKYLNNLDNNQWYSNYGPLYHKTKSKLENEIRYSNNSIVLTSSGHSSLLAVCKLLRSKIKKKYVLCPSLSFYSNPLAILEAGFEPYFVDIDNEDLIMDSKLINNILNKNNNIAFLMYVSPYGKPIDINWLNNIHKKYNLPVVYDAADSLLNLNKKINKNKIFITCSFHPTKTLGANESGAIICETKYSEKLKKILNFGIGLKDKKILGFNGKFSEYDAAIFLANYDHIKKKIKLLNKIKKSFLKNLNCNYEMISKEIFVSNKITFKTNINLVKINKTLKDSGLHAFKLWSNKSMHELEPFKKCKKTKMKNTILVKKKTVSFYINNTFETRKIINKLNSI